MLHKLFLFIKIKPKPLKSYVRFKAYSYLTKGGFLKVHDLFLKLDKMFYEIISRTTNLLPSLEAVAV